MGLGTFKFQTRKQETAMNSFRHAIYRDYDEAEKAIHAGAADIAIVANTMRTGMCTFYMRAQDAPPAVLRDLPGYRPLGISGISGSPICYYEILRTLQEVVDALIGLEPNQKPGNLACLNPSL